MTVVDTARCGEIRARLDAAAQGPADPLPETVRVHLAACPACALHLAERTVDSRPDPTPIEPSAGGNRGLAIAALAASLGGPGSFPAGRFARWVVGAGPPAPHALRAVWAVIVLLGFIAAVLCLPAKRPYRPAAPAEVGPASPELRRSVEEGLRGLAGIPEGRDLLKAMIGRGFFGVAMRPVGLRGDETIRPMAEQLCGWYRRTETPGLWQVHGQVMAVARRLEAGGSSAARLLLYRLTCGSGRFGWYSYDPVPHEFVEKSEGISRRLLQTAADPLPHDPVERLEVLIGGLGTRSVPSALEPGVCRDALDLRWSLLDRRGASSPSRDLFVAVRVWQAGYCRRDREETLHRRPVDPLVELARFRLRHAVEADGPRGAVLVLVDPAWRLPMARWLLWTLRWAMPGAVLGLAVWVLWAHRRHGAALGAASVLAPRVTHSVATGSLLLVAIVLLVGEAGGLLWVPLTHGSEPRSWGRCIEGLVGFLDAGPSDGQTRPAYLLRLALLCAAALCVAILHARVASALGPQFGRPPWVVLGYPWIAALLACGHAWDTLVIEGPLSIALLLLPVVIYLARRPRPAGYPIVAYGLSGAVSILVANLWIGTPWRAGDAAWSASVATGLLVVVLLPMATGHILAHLSPGQLRSSRALVLAVGLAGPVLAGLLELSGWVPSIHELAPGGPRSWLITPPHRTSLITLVYLLAVAIVPWMSMRLGALLAPDGAGALAAQPAHGSTGWRATLAGIVDRPGRWLVPWILAWAFLVAQLILVNVR